MNSDKRRYLFLLVLILLSSSICTGQLNSDRPLVFNNINKEHGLPNNFVNCTEQDEHGFIWIGTTDGLCRFDSHDKFKIYKDKDENIPGGLQSSFISALHLGTTNTLYIGTRQGGLTIYDIENDIWETYTNAEDDPTSISNDEVLSILEDSKGRLWVGTEYGLNLFDKKTKTFRNYLPEQNQEGKLMAKSILSIIEDNNGWIWVGTWDGGMYLLVTDPKSSDVYFRHFNPEGQTKRNCIWTIYHDEYDNYWVGSHSEGLYLMSIPEEAKIADNNWQPSFRQFSHEVGNDKSLSGNYISHITKDSEGNLWIATVKGISIVPNETVSKKLDIETKPSLKFYNNIYDSSIKTSIPDNNVFHIKLDNSGIIWLSTRSGSSRYCPLSNQIQDFKLFDVNYEMPNSQNYYLDQNNLAWIAAGEEGLFHYNKQENSYHEAFPSKLYNHDFISAIYSKNHKDIFIASEKAIIKYNQVSKKITEYFFEENAPINVKRSRIGQIIEDDKSNLWLMSEGGVVRFNLLSEQFDYFKNDPLNPNSIVDNSITQILINSKHEIWISTYNGLSKVIVDDDENVSFQNFMASKEEGALQSNKITAMVDIDSILILGTRSGIFGYHYEKTEFQDYRSANEKMAVNSLIAVPNGEVWGVGLNSVFKFEPTNKQLLSFDFKEGAASSQYLSKSVVLSKDTTLHFGNMTGFTLVNPIKFKTNTTPPNISFTEVEIFSPAGRKQVNMVHQNELEISSNHYSIEINFAALNYIRPEKTKYAYILEGFDQEWKYLDKYVSPNYTNLDHGNYTFKAKAANEVGIWSKEISLNIRVKPSFIETDLAKGLILIVSGLLVYLLVKFNTVRIKRRNKELQDFNQSLNKEIKQKEAFELALQKANLELTRSNQELEQFAYIASHDLQEPLRITGSFIDLLGERYADVLDDNAFKFIEFAKGGVGRMGLLIKNLLTFSKVGGTVLDFQKVSTKNIVEEKLLDLGVLIADKNAQIELGNLPDIICEKNQIAMLIYNLINNALKFNDKPNPIVKISSQPSEDPNLHSFYVSDNGIGIEEEHKELIFEIFKRLHAKDQFDGTGIGLALCKKIVDRHGGNIWIDSTIGEGTTFNFTLMKDPTKLKDDSTFVSKQESAPVS